MTPFQENNAIIWLEEADSTNKELRKRIGELDNLSVIAAMSQTAGRGQGTHTWFSTAGKNLTFSVLYRHDSLPVSEALLVTCSSTLAVRDYLLKRAVKARIKWPNDIWVGNKKICGMLIENILDGCMIKESIVGIGLNLNETGWPKELPNPVSLKELTGLDYDLKLEMEALHKEICHRFAQMGSSDGRSSLQEEFGKNMFRLTEEP